MVVFMLTNLKNKRKGAFIAFFPMLIIVMIAMGGIVVDISFARVTYNQLQTATDAAALAGATALVNGSDAAQNAANATFDHNLILSERANNIVIEVGRWEEDTFTPSAGGEAESTPNAVKVTAEATPPSYFIPLLRDLLREEEAIAIAGNAASSTAINSSSERDIIFVVDAGRDMNAFTSYRHQRDVPSGVTKYKTAVGYVNYPCCFPNHPPADFVAGAGDLSFHPLLGRIATNATKFVAYPIMYTLNTIKSLMKWTDGPVYLPYKKGGENWVAPYPYPAGSWNNYIAYVKVDFGVSSAGYRGTYFTGTWDSYLMDMYPGYSESPRLWLSETIQPWESTRVAVRDVITNHLTDSSDHIGLVLFNGVAPDSAVLERQLATENGSDVDVILHGIKTTNPVPGNPDLFYFTAVQPGRQPGHYSMGSIIYPGLSMAIDELTSDRSREDAKKIIVLFSSADFNAIITSFNPFGFFTNFIETVQPEVDRAIQHNIKIHTVGYQYLGQPELLQTHIAEPTGGQSLIVPYPATNRDTGGNAILNEPYLFSDILADWLNEGDSAQLVK